MTDQPGRKDQPVSTRFKKGQSGNPKGRPKKRETSRSSAFDVVIDKTLTVTQGGRPREVTVEEALQHQTYKEALAGSRSARREVLKMIAKREAYLATQIEKNPPKFTVHHESGDPDNADQALLILGIATPDPSENVSAAYGTPLQLEPWAVQAALSRRRGGRKLIEEDINDIKRCTRDPDSLRWPRRSDA